MKSREELLAENETMTDLLIDCGKKIRDQDQLLKKRRPDGHVHFMEVWMAEKKEGQFLFSFPARWEDLPDENKVYAIALLVEHFEQYLSVLSGDQAEGVYIQKGSLEDFNEARED